MYSYVAGGTANSLSRDTMNSPLKQAVQGPVQLRPTIVSYSWRKSYQCAHWQPSQSHLSMMDRHSMVVSAVNSCSRGNSLGPMNASGTAWLNHTCVLLTSAECSVVQWL